MSRSGLIHIRPDATPEQCRAIAAAVERWYRREFNRLRLAWLDDVALHELAEGRLPTPAWERLRGLAVIEDDQRRVLSDDELREWFGESRALGWAQSYSGDAEEAERTLRAAVEGLVVERVELE